MELEFSSVDFCGGKTGEPGEKPSERGREPTTNSIGFLEFPFWSIKVLQCLHSFSINEIQVYFLIFYFFFSDKVRRED